jgi:hypothetical protein
MDGVLGEKLGDDGEFHGLKKAKNTSQFYKVFTISFETWETLYKYIGECIINDAIGLGHPVEPTSHSTDKTHRSHVYIQLSAHGISGCFILSQVIK